LFSEICVSCYIIDRNEVVTVNVISIGDVIYSVHVEASAPDQLDNNEKL